MQFARITTTRMACPDQDRETEILLALEEVENARLTEKDRVEMYGKDGRLLLTLSRLNLTQDES